MKIQADFILTETLYYKNKHSLCGNQAQVFCADHLECKAFDGGVNQLINAFFAWGYICFLHRYDVDDRFGDVENSAYFTDSALTGAFHAGFDLRQGCLRQLAFFCQFILRNREFLPDSFDGQTDVHIAKFKVVKRINESKTIN